MVAAAVASVVDLVGVVWGVFVIMFCVFVGGNIFFDRWLAVAEDFLDESLAFGVVFGAEGFIHIA